MQNEGGFTLVETLFVLFIVCMTSVLTITFHAPIKKEQQIINEISSFLYEAKLESMVSKQKVTVQFEKNVISYSCGDDSNQYRLDEKSYFDNHSFTYNEYGHIKGAKTVHLYMKDQSVQFVYQVGSGCFYVQS